MSVLKVKNGNQWDIVPAIKGDPGDPAADESITDDMLVTDGIKTEIEWLWGNQLTDSREGELLHAEDAYTAPAVDISVDGKSTQVTTTGKNLLNPDFSYWTSYNLPDIGTRNGILIPVNTGTYNYHNRSNIDMMYGWVDDADNVESTYIDGANITQHLNAGTQIIADGTHPFILIYTYTGTPQQNIYDRQPMLEYGATNTGYEPYTGGKPSPSPDYPQEIVSVESAKLDFSGKNLINVVNRDGVVVDGNTITVTGTNRDLFTGTTGRSTVVADLSKLPLLPAGTFAFSCNKTGSSNLYLDFADSEGRVHNIRVSAAADTHMAWKFTLDEPTRITVRATGTTITDLQIEVGDVATEYVPFDSLISVLYNNDAPLRSLPDGTKDELHLSYLRPSKRVGWAWYSRELVKRVVRTIYDGSETWNYETTSRGFRNFYRTKPSNTNNGTYGAHVQCSHGTANDGPVYAIKNGTYISAAGNTNLCFGDALDISSAEEFASWLSENPVTFDCPAATPTTETLDPIELPIMPSRTVNVWSDPATNLKMTYIQDSNLIIENLEATIADIATS